ncbi:MAG: Nuclease SbcCD subunit D [Candidatus Ordinivivax streblomastigis]|uniref:Nuclease SbcCD subunit D n=1 Tax=Candidatus Ordinivivax streblomastigis TaxID=2540710 RepID=A0A5M8P3R2_9BACT|nr:MAG: Nuclease SbcCD subunit D [Candidatus Ordinivivax streblomastigis]
MSKNSLPCVLLLNDIHISKDNIPEFTANWMEALSVCDRMNIDTLVLGGDLFQSRSAQTLDVLLAIHDALLAASKRDIKVILANGNHDKVNQESIRGYCHVFDRYENVTVVDDFLSVDNPEWAFILHVIPYFPENGSFTEKLGALVAGGLDKERLNYLYIHEGINGALAHSSENELPAHIFGSFDRIFVGHYHDRIIIKGTNIEYIGSSRQHNFGEDEEKGYTVLYTDGTQIFVKNNVNTRYQVMDVPVEKVDIHLADRLEEIKADGRYRVKVRVHASSAKASGIDKGKLLDAGASKVEIVTEEVEITENLSSGLFEKFDNRKIRKNYEQFCREKEIENVALGLSYLSKIENTCGN